MALKGNKKSTQKKYTFFEQSQNNKKRKRLSVVMQYYVISIFVFISLLCTGFASWVTVGLTAGSAGGSSFGAYESIHQDNYVTLDSITCFDYCEIGFIKKNNSTGYHELSDTASVTVSYTLNCDALKNDFSSVNYKIKFTIYGTRADGSTLLTIFESEYFDNVTFLIKGDINPLNNTYEKDDSDDSTKVTYSVSKSTLNSAINAAAEGESITIIATYIFSCENGDKFSENVYQQIQTTNDGSATFYAYATLVPTN